MNTDTSPVRVSVVLEAHDLPKLDATAALNFATRSAFVRKLILEHLRDREAADRAAGHREAARP